MNATTVWEPVRLRGLELRNRVWLSPMAQYSADGDGVPTDWHLAHYGARAAGGVGLVVVECTAVAPDQRTTRADLGLWSDEQVPGHARVAEIVRAAGSVPGVQIGVAGRKTSHGIPWDDSGTRHAVPVEDGGWEAVAPSALRFADLARPRAMTADDGTRMLDDLSAAARRAHRAGYEFLELHGANGYLLHQFLSPLANRRTDAWGGDLEGRMRFPLAMVGAVRAGWPPEKPLLVRLPATDLLDGGLTLDEAVLVATRMAASGVDMVDLESGTLTPEAPRPSEPLHNARFGPHFRTAGLATAASGFVTEAAHLDEAVPGLVDVVLVGRALLRDPYWALRAHGGDPRATWPRPYHRALTPGGGVGVSASRRSTRRAAPSR